MKPIAIPTTLQASETAIISLESKFGSLPHGYLAFIGKHDGAMLTENEVQFEGSRTNIEHFIPAKDIPKVADSIDGFPKGMIPFARAAGGNIFYLNPKTGEVFFWDHEIEAKDSRVSQSFESFLLLVRESTLGDVKLAPGQVLKVRVDPNFQPKFKP